MIFFSWILEKLKVLEIKNMEMIPCQICFDQFQTPVFRLPFVFTAKEISTFFFVLCFEIKTWVRRHCTNISVQVCFWWPPLIVLLLSVCVCCIVFVVCSLCECVSLFLVDCRFCLFVYVCIRNVTTSLVRGKVRPTCHLNIHRKHLLQLSCMK